MRDTELVQVDHRKPLGPYVASPIIGHVTHVPYVTQRDCYSGQTKKVVGPTNLKVLNK